MRNLTSVFVVVLLLAIQGGCERQTTDTQEPKDRLDLDSLIENLNQRRSWDVRHVKIPLARPDVIAKQANGMLLEAWAENQNDFHVPMLRLDQADRLYEMSADEFLRVLDIGTSGFLIDGNDLMPDEQSATEK